MREHDRRDRRRRRRVQEHRPRVTGSDAPSRRPHLDRLTTVVEDIGVADEQDTGAILR